MRFFCIASAPVETQSIASLQIGAGTDAWQCGDAKHCVSTKKWNINALLKPAHRLQWTDFDTSYLAQAGIDI